MLTVLFAGPTAMQALVRDTTGIVLAEVARPALRPDDVLVRVMAVGLCRTDLYVADGRIRCRPRLILGHEFSGVVEEVGPEVSGLSIGARVAVFPFLSCGNCSECRRGAETTCTAPQMLGLDRDGALAEFVAVPARVVRVVPPTLSFEAAAYAEPVAAGLAVLHSGVRADERGAIFGHNRFARLVAAILECHGFSHVDVSGPADRPPADAYDFAVETHADAETLAAIVRAVRPFGRVVLKSRPPRLVGLDLAAVVRKELTLRAVHYGPFADAVDLLASGRLDVRPLLGPVRPMADFQAVFAAARTDESAKYFLSPAR